ncbi:MAG: polyphenol oxidase family protein, partial [Bariatricus massiliensis]|nr:polyphenol oxidase family protein [Bariatricus massiliensis]
MRFEYKNAEHIYTEKNCNGVLFLEFPLLSETGVVRHGISTREGGVSEGIYRSMNLSFARGDKEEHVMENYRRIGAAIGVSPDRMTASSQTHTTNVRAVTEDDIGKGIVYPRDYTDVDGLMTNLPDVCLVTYYADCVPLLFVDPVHRAIASSHSGWRGTVNRMGEITVQAMQRAYGSRPEDIVAAIGPSICQDCYEVSEDVIERFRAAFPETEWASLFYGKPDGKFQLNLWRANEL